MQTVNQILLSIKKFLHLSQNKPDIAIPVKMYLLSPTRINNSLS